jgi:hypothetical protein
LLGLTTREAFRECLDALRASVESRADELARWLAKLVAQSQSANSDLRNTQLRRHLAVRMANELVSSHAADMEMVEEESRSEEDAFSGPIGRECLTYRAFIRPFVEGQLAAFLSLRIDPTKRPDDLPGDKELAALCDRYNLRPV